jgi:hypothetical protein
MPPYNLSPAIIEISGSELRKIAALLSERQEVREDPKTVLIGGWAVDAYNPYLGSQDIDLVTDNETRQWLIDRLARNEGYTPHIQYPSDTVKKVTLHGEIILDIIYREIPYPFEGDPEIPFTFNILNGNTVFRNIRGGARIPVPNRSILVLLKLKAAWDRSYRLIHQRSRDPYRERSKMIKDYADVLALIDPAHGGREIDLEILGAQISRFTFLKELILRIPNLGDVRERYQTMTQQDIRRLCEDFESIL